MYTVETTASADPNQIVVGRTTLLAQVPCTLRTPEIAGALPTTVPYAGVRFMRKNFGLKIALEWALQFD